MTDKKYRVDIGNSMKKITQSHNNNQCCPNCGSDNVKRMDIVFTSWNQCLSCFYEFGFSDDMSIMDESSDLMNIPELDNGFDDFSSGLGLASDTPQKVFSQI